jgi:hypothetical protein
MAARRVLVKRSGLLLMLAACRAPATTASVETPVDAGTVADALEEPVAAQIDPDGNDDPEDPGTGTIGGTHFERVGRTPWSLKRVCDLTPLGGALYAAHAYAPLGIDGATITRFTPPGKFEVAFDWNRPGEPTKGGGAGQGFARVRGIEGKLWVPDSDPPYDGFGLADHGTEGYVFVSDEQGKFEKAQGEHFRPPKTTLVVPRAYHDLDVIHFRGKVWASTGAVPPGERAWHDSSPGALHAFDGKRFAYVVGYPKDATADVWRLTFMVRFKDVLYAGIQEYYPREPNDFVTFDGTTLEGKRVTDQGGALTMRWYADKGALYWIALDRDGIVRLRKTSDGEHWSVLDVSAGGSPNDIVRFRDALVVLGTKALVRIDNTVIASWKDEKLFAQGDIFCAAPLAVFQNELYAGSQKDGALWRLSP